MMQTGVEEFIGVVEGGVGESRLGAPLKIAGVEGLGAIEPRVGGAPGVFIKKGSILVDLVNPGND